MKNKKNKNRRENSHEVAAVADQVIFVLPFEVSTRFRAIVDGSDNTRNFKKPLNFKQQGKNNILNYTGTAFAGGEIVVIYDYD